MLSVPFPVDPDHAPGEINVFDDKVKMGVAAAGDELPYDLEAWGTLGRSTQGIEGLSNWDRAQFVKNALNFEFTCLKAIVGEPLPRLNLSHQIPLSIIRAFVEGGIRR